MRMTRRTLLGEPELSLEGAAIDRLGDGSMLSSECASGLGMLLTAWGADGSIVKTVEGVARLMVAREQGEGPVEVGEVGASGGVCVVMPNREDAEVLRGPVPMYDSDLLLNGGDEPLGHIPHHEDEATPTG